MRLWETPTTESFVQKWDKKNKSKWEKEKKNFV